MDQLRALRVFERVVSDGSFAQAARSLDLTPPVVTRLLAELETHLGVRLLNRTTRRIALTAAGQAYLESARRVLTELHDAGAEPSRVVTLPLSRAALSTAHIDMLLASAVSGPGIAGLPSFAVSAALREGRLERVLPHWRSSAQTLYAAMPTRKQVPARTRLFFDFLVETFGKGDGDPWLDGRMR